MARCGLAEIRRDYTPASIAVAILLPVEATPVIPRRTETALLRYEPYPSSPRKRVEGQRPPCPSTRGRQTATATRQRRGRGGLPTKMLAPLHYRHLVCYRRLRQARTRRGTSSGTRSSAAPQAGQGTQRRPKRYRRLTPGSAACLSVATGCRLELGLTTRTVTGTLDRSWLGHGVGPFKSRGRARSSRQHTFRLSSSAARGTLIQSSIGRRPQGRWNAAKSTGIPSALGWPPTAARTSSCLQPEMAGQATIKSISKSSAILRASSASFALTGKKPSTSRHLHIHSAAGW